MGKHTPGDWQVFNMIHAERHERMTPDEIGEYVANSIRKTLSDGGSNDFLFVSTGEGAPDICHVGNGPAGPANARLIAAAPDLLAALRRVVAVADRQTDEFDAARAAITKAEGG
jgi:hypothetical protein